jgi:transcriptional regulator with XRE-family HTH domain
MERAPSRYDELVQLLDHMPVIIRETRRRKGLTLHEAAAQSGVPASVLSRVDRGLNDLSLRSLKAVLVWSQQ